MNWLGLHGRSFARFKENRTWGQRLAKALWLLLYPWAVKVERLLNTTLSDIILHRLFLFSCARIARGSIACDSGPPFFCVQNDRDAHRHTR